MIKIGVNMNLQPTQDNVLVEIEAAGERVVGGIVLPESASRGPAIKIEEATVLAIGPGRYSISGEILSPPVAVGAKVLIYRSMGTEMTSGDRRLVIVSPKDILAVVEGERQEQRSCPTAKSHRKAAKDAERAQRNKGN
jgi:chaperonin GroES